MKNLFYKLGAINNDVRCASSIRLSLISFCLLLGLNQGWATTYYVRAGGGAWDSPATWSTVASNGAAASSFPGASDDVVFDDGGSNPAGTVTIAAGMSFTCNSLTVNNTASAPFNVNYFVVISNGSSLTVNGNVALTSYANTEKGSIQILGNGTLTVGGNLSSASSGGGYNGELDMSNGASITTVKGNVTFPVTASFLPGSASTFIYAGSGAQTVAALPYYNLTINKPSGIATLAAAITSMTGDLSVLSGTFADGFKITGTAGHAVNVSNGATLDIFGAAAVTFPATFNIVNLGPTSTVSFSATTAKTIPAWNYGNLVSSSTGARVLANAGTIGVAGTFTPGTNAYTVTGSTVQFNGTGPQTIPAFNYNNLSITNSGANITLSGTAGVAGTFTPPAAAFGINTGTIDYNATTAQSVAAFYYNNLTVSGARTTNSVTFPASTVYVSGIFNPSATFTSGAYIKTGNTMEFNGSAAQTLPAFNYNNLTSSGTGSRTLANAGTIGVQGIFTPGVNTYTSTGSTVDYNGTGAQSIVAFNYNNLTISQARTTNNVTLASAGKIGIAGTFTYSATYTSGTLVNTSSTVEYNGSPAQNIIVFPYNNLNINNAGLTASLAGNLNAPAPAGDVAVLAGTLSTNGFVLSGTLGKMLTVSTGATLNISGATANFPAGFTVNLSPLSTVNYSGPGAQTIDTQNYGHLISSNAGARTLTTSGNIRVAGNFTSGTNTYTVGTSTVEFNGSAAQSLSGNLGTSAPLYNLSVNNSGTGLTDGLTLNSGLTVNNQLTLSKGKLILNNQTLTVSNSANTAITRTAGIIVSEGNAFNGKVQWNTSTSTGLTYLFPLGTAANIYIPLSINVTSGNLQNLTVASYGTALSDNLPLPGSVTGMYNQGSSDTANTAVNRFWQIISSNGTPGTSTITFTCTADEAKYISAAKAQMWNGTSWSAPVSGQTLINDSTVTDPNVSAYSIYTLYGSNLPIAQYNSDRTTLCAGSAVVFVDNSLNSTGRTWNFQGGSPASSTAATVTVTYPVAGNYDVQLLSTNSHGTSPLNNSAYITVYSIPTATFSTTSPVCEGSNSIITYTGSATGAASYTWDFTGGNIASGTAGGPYNVNWSVAGTKNIYLTVTENGCTSAVGTNTVVVDPVLTPTVTIVANPGTTVCEGTPVSFTATPGNGGSAPSYQWKVGTTNVGTDSPSYSDNALNNNDVVSCIMTSNASCLSTPTSTATLTMTVDPTFTPVVSLSANPGTSICEGTSVTFTATPVSGAGTTPVYQWSIDGNVVGTNSATFTSNTLSDGNAITCQMTSNANCAVPAVVNSNTLTLLVTPTVLPTITISANPGTGICEGTSVTFTAITTNEGSTPSYQWMVDGSAVGSDSPTFTSSTLADNNVVSCQLTSNAACATPAVVLSNNLTMIVTPTVTPDLTITANPGTTNCEGASVTFSAASVNGGSSPSYQWMIGTNNVGTNSSAFTSNTLNNNDAVSCIMTSNAACLTTPSASATLVMTVNPTFTPVISIAANPGTSICEGTNVNFTATPVSGSGSNPAYQWTLNGNNVGGNSTNFNSSSLTNSDVIGCVMNSNANCATPAVVNSNTLTMLVTPTVLPTISISANPGTAICEGTNVTFSAGISNGGAAPSYQWMIDGNVVGTDSPVFASSTLSNNNLISCQLTSNAACATPPTVVSNALTMIVTPTVTPVVTISANPGTGICEGTNVIFTAVPVNGGTSPNYQWQIDGSNVASTSASFSSSVLSDGNIIKCIMTSNAACYTSATASSNSLTMIVTPTVLPTVSISSNPGTTICDGTQVTFSASATHQGNNPVYQWSVNGVDQGTNSTGFTINTLANGNTVSCKLISDAACIVANGMSASLSMTVNPTFVPVVSITSDKGLNVCEGTEVSFTAVPVDGGTNPVYQWKINGNNAGTNSPSFVSTLNSSDQISCSMTSNANCPAPSAVNSNILAMNVTPTVLPAVAISSDNNGLGICSDEIVVVTASSQNGGNTPHYQWKLNGQNAGTDDYRFTGVGLNNNDVITCNMTSNIACASVNQVSSNDITMKVNKVVNPTVTIGVNPGTSVCQGTEVQFDASVQNPGTNPSYKWKVNGVVSGTQNTFITSGLQDADIVTCELTSNALCVSSAVVNSNALKMKVSPFLVPAVDISSDKGSVICDQTKVKFTASAVNGGLNPSYQWMLNGLNTGINAGSYISSTLKDGDIVSCKMTSSYNCPVTPEAEANDIAMTVKKIPFTQASIFVTQSQICEQAPYDFGSQIIGGGTDPVYKWKINGDVFANTPVNFTSTSLQNGDVVSLEMQSSEECALPALSNPITVNLKPMVLAQIEIGVSKNFICEKEAVTFTTNIKGGGTNPGFQWQLNGSNVGTDASTLDLSNLKNNDYVECLLKSSEECVVGYPWRSNAVVMSVTSIEKPEVRFFANNLLCETPASSYQWYQNGKIITGATQGTLSLTKSGTYTVMITAGSCSQMSDPFKVDITGTTVKETSHLKVFPNPVSSSFTLQLETASSGQALIVLTDLYGREIMKVEKLAGSGLSEEFDISDLSSGIYYLTVKTGAEQVIEKIVKLK